MARPVAVKRKKQNSATSITKVIAITPTSRVVINAPNKVRSGNGLGNSCKV